MKILKYYFLFIFILKCVDVDAQFNYQRTYGFSTINEGKVVKKAIGGGFIIAGNTSINNTDIYLLKINDDGTLQWQNTIGSIGIEHANAMTLTYDSCYVIVGYTNGFNSSGDYNIYLVKTDQNGQLIWHRELGGADWDFGFSIKETPDSGFIIAGNTYNGISGSSDGIFLKTDSLGNFIWENIFNTPGNDYLYGVDITSDGNYVATGTMIEGNGGSKDIIIEKVDLNGDSIWFKEYGSLIDEESNAIFSRVGTSMIVGSNRDTLGLNNLSFRINDNGDSLSTVILSPPLDEITTAIDTGVFFYFITGYTTSNGAGNKDLFISKIDTLGNNIQGSTYGGSENEIGYSIFATQDGGAIAVGSSTTYAPGTQSLYIVKADSNLVANSNVIIGLAEINNKLNAFGLYSDPFSHVLNVNCDPNYKDIYKLNIDIFDQNGKIIPYTKSIFDCKIQIELENNLPGIYIINMTDKEGLFVVFKFLFN